MLVACADHAADEPIARWGRTLVVPKFVLAGDPPQGWRHAVRLDPPLLPLHLEQRILAACTLAERRPDLVRAVAAYELPLSWLPWWPGSTARRRAAAEAEGSTADAAEQFMRRMLGDAIRDALDPRLH